MRRKGRSRAGRRKGEADEEERRRVEGREGDGKEQEEGKGERRGSMSMIDGVGQAMARMNLVVGSRKCNRKGGK